MINLKEYVQKYVNLVKDKSTTQKKIQNEILGKNTFTVEDYMEKLLSPDLQELIKTGYILFMCMEVLPLLQKSNITKSDIYEEYIKSYI